MYAGQVHLHPVQRRAFSKRHRPSVSAVCLLAGHLPHRGLYVYMCVYLCVYVCIYMYITHARARARARTQTHIHIQYTGMRGAVERVHDLSSWHFLGQVCVSVKKETYNRPKEAYLYPKRDLQIYWHTCPAGTFSDRCRLFARAHSQ